MKTLLTSLALVLAPMAAIAAGCGHETSAMSCADGTVYDSEQRRCVPATG